MCSATCACYPVKRSVDAIHFPTPVLYRRVRFSSWVRKEIECGITTVAEGRGCSRFTKRLRADSEWTWSRRKRAEEQSERKNRSYSKAFRGRFHACSPSQVFGRTLHPFSHKKSTECFFLQIEFWVSSLCRKPLLLILRPSYRSFLFQFQPRYCPVTVHAGFAGRAQRRALTLKWSAVPQRDAGKLAAGSPCCLVLCRLYRPQRSSKLVARENRGNTIHSGANRVTWPLGVVEMFMAPELVRGSSVRHFPTLSSVIAGTVPEQGAEFTSHFFLGWLVHVIPKVRPNINRPAIEPFASCMVPAIASPQLTISCPPPHLHPTHAPPSVGVTTRGLVDPKTISKLSSSHSVLLDTTGSRFAVHDVRWVRRVR